MWFSSFQSNGNDRTHECEVFFLLMKLHFAYMRIRFLFLGGAVPFSACFHAFYLSKAVKVTIKIHIFWWQRENDDGIKWNIPCVCDVCIFTRVVFFALLFFLCAAKKWYRISENSVWILPYIHQMGSIHCVFFSFLQMMRYTWQLGICAPVCLGILTHFCYRYSVSFSFLFDFVTLFWRMTVLVAQHAHTHTRILLIHFSSSNAFAFLLF